MLIDYEGRRFRGEVAPDGSAPIATYHQDGDLVWAESGGGRVRRCVLTGVRDDQGVITMGYTMVLVTGEIVLGRCVSTPEPLPDGRIRLVERYERYLPLATSGETVIEELPTET
ncbi:hypothetical protein [Actinokineospora enzanensis]|uniref:hypothetical protein n=1 Tax=Actinokineospora enzanensis TaxID=155975 RepID=UPI00037D6D65|nr:hypothetical protein [Actinokineospora enzanensis]